MGETEKTLRLRELNEQILTITKITNVFRVVAFLVNKSVDHTRRPGAGRSESPLKFTNHYLKVTAFISKNVQTSWNSSILSAFLRIKAMNRGQAKRNKQKQARELKAPVVF